MAVSDKDVPYSWGQGNCGQLGHGNRPRELIPKAISYFTLHGIAAAACFAGALHSGVLSRSGDLYMFGRNNCGELGFNDVQRINMPRKLAIGKMRDASLGLKYSAIIAFPS